MEAFIKIISLTALGCLAAGCGLTAATTTGSKSTTSSAATSSSTAVLSVAQFLPASATLTAQPTLVQVQFSNAYVDYNQAILATNYTMACGTSSAYASAISYSAGLATLSFPALSVASGTTCSVLVGSGIYDSYGNYLSGIRQADYYISSSSSTFSWSEVATVSYTAGAGGSGGASFSDAGSDTLALYGFVVSAGSYVTSLGGIWARPAETLAYGTVHGTSSTTTTVNCPSGYRMTGIYGYYGTVLNAIGITCMNAGQTQSYQSSLVGTSSGTPFSYSCGSGQFATVLYGRAGSLVDQVGLGCR